MVISPSPSGFAQRSNIVLCPLLQELSPQPPQKLPDFGFPSFPIATKLASTPMALDSLSSSSLLDSRQQESLDQCRITFTSIPTEIRLHIYLYVLLIHPVRHAHLASVSNLPLPLEGLRRPQISFHSELPNLTPLGRSIPSQLLLSQSCMDRYSKTISPSKIPFGLLVSCRQIYEETRLLPFHSSNFSFINWHNDGIYAARHFSRSLREWQSDALRHVSLEIRDYHLKSWNLEEWKELVSLWCGVRQLRLFIQSSSKRKANSTTVLDARLDLESRRDAYLRSQGGGFGVSGVPGEAADNFELFSIESRWVKEGLLNLKGLRYVELRIEDEGIDRDVKLEFCSALEGLLCSKARKWEDGCDREVKVALVENPEEMIGETEEVSAPTLLHNTNDTIWGLGV
ncbi:hypothetical protein BGZ60DRAFT_193589 [Tricladium varicosporioides]|nr:hypothetical protein BGZ60DRAFT_193589 [Hymenoscyphus varicosporioides]